MMNRPATADSEATVGLATLVAPIVERAWRVLLVAALVGAAAVGLVLARPPKYEAQIVAATVSNGPTLSLGSAASLLGAGTQASGFSANPALVSTLFESRRVLQAVGTSRLGEGGTRVVDAAEGAPVPGTQVVKVMDRLVRARVDKETGLITVRVAHPDSALARLIASRLIDETTRAFVGTARAQATEQRRAQEARVDSAARRLRRAQQQAQAFLSENRTLAEYSAGNIDRQALERELGLAETIYNKAVADRESAVAKELEETPVLVVVDPLPGELPRIPRFAVVIGFVAALAAMIFAVIWIFVGEAFRRHAAAMPADAARLRTAAARLGPRRGRGDRRAAYEAEGAHVRS